MNNEEKLSNKSTIHKIIFIILFTLGFYCGFIIITIKYYLNRLVNFFHITHSEQNLKFPCCNRCGNELWPETLAIQDLDEVEDGIRLYWCNKCHADVKVDGDGEICSFHKKN